MKKFQLMASMLVVISAVACSKGSGNSGNPNPAAKPAPAPAPGPSGGAGNANGGDGQTGVAGADPVDGSACPSNVVADAQVMNEACSKMGNFDPSTGMPEGMQECSDAQSAFGEKHPNIKCVITGAGQSGRVCGATNNPALSAECERWRKEK